MRSKATFRARSSEAAINEVAASAYVIPTEEPESDGTFAWNSTTLVVSEVGAAGLQGFGYTYADAATATLIDGLLAEVVRGRDAFDVPGTWTAMQHAVRNLGRQGICATAISALDAAVWDLKGRLLEASVSTLLGRAHDAVPIYGSGGFTSYPTDRLERQLAGWAQGGIRSVKMKVGRDADADPDRVRAARAAIGPKAELFVDANGAWTPARALAMAERFAPFDVSWFEEPVSSDDLDGLAYLREHAPTGMEIAAGEYGYDLPYFRRMLEARAVDVLQADATRCGGITGFLQAGTIAGAFGVPLSAHTAPSLHVAPCCALPRTRHIEYFHDHVRIEQMLFDGAPQPQDGLLSPDTSRPGLGLEFKRADAARFRVR